jgi:methyl-accepting chemotaxis protein
MKWYRNRSLSVKFLSVLGLCLLLVFGSLVVFNLWQLHQVSVSNGKMEARLAGKEFSESFSGNMTSVHSMLQTLSETLLEAREKQNMTRAQVVELLQLMLERRTDAVGLYTAWEPNAFDQNDKAHINLTPYDDATGRFVPYIVRSNNQIGSEPLIGYEKEGEGDYYQIPKKTKKVSYLDPYHYQIGNEDVLLMSVSVPMLDKSGTFYGIVGMDIRLDQLQKESEEFKPLGGYVALISGSGQYVANGNDVSSLGKPFGDNPEKAALWEGIKTGGITEEYTLNSKGLKVARFFDPVKLPASEAVWFAQTAVPEETVLQKYYDSRLISILLVIAAMVVLSGLLALLVHLMVVRWLKLLVGKLQLMAEGDLTQRLDIQGKDEFGMMAHYFNVMTERLRGMFQMVTELTMSVGATSQELSAAAEQTSKASESIAVSAQDVASGAESQSRHATQTVSAMNEMSIGIERIAGSSVAVASLVGDANSRTLQGSVKIAEAVKQMGNMQAAVNETEQAIERLSERSEQIDKVIGLISGISKQTNLLALNAAIEASRVGEQGKGFAVVAQEVRSLAEQSKQSAEQVQALVEEIRNDTRSAAMLMARGQSEVAVSVTAVSESGELFEAITKGISKLNDQIQEVSATAQQMSASSEQIKEGVDQLAYIAGEASANSANVAAASEEQLASMEEISSSSEALSVMVQELLEKMSQFKI